MFDVPFLIAARKYAYLWFYLLFLIPIVNLFAILAIKIYLGIKGREIARTSKTFASEEEFLGFMKGFDWAGKVLFFVGLTVFVLGLIATFAFGAAVADFAPFEFYMNSTPQQ